MGVPKVGETWVYSSTFVDWDNDQEFVVTKIGDWEVYCRFKEGTTGAAKRFIERDCTFAISRFESGEFRIKEGKVVAKGHDCWNLVEKVIPVSRIVLLYGPPGTGKTTAGNKISFSKFEEAAIESV